MIDVALASDRAYLPHAAVSLRSLLLATADPAAVRPHLLHGPALDPADVDRLAGMVDDLGSTLRPLRVTDDHLRGLPVNRRFPPPIWYRTLLPKLLPDAPRVVYLDCDTLVLGDVGELAAMDLGGRAVAAVDNVSLGSEADAARADLAPGTRYFNSGVLVLDLETWRREHLADAVHAEGMARQAAPFPDQDALNAVLAHRRLSLHPRWNCQITMIYLREAREVLGAATLAEACAHPAIVHFEGKAIDKPWHHLSKHPHRDAYLEHRAHTPWPTDVIQGRTVFNRLLRPFPRRVVGRVSRARERLGA